MKNKKFLWIIVISFHLFCFSCQAQRVVETVKDQKGLVVINDVSVYEQTVKADSNKQMVLLNEYIHPLVADWVYATSNNFTHTILYHHPLAFSRLNVAKALRDVEEVLQRQGLGLMFYDAYRPYSVTKKMWEVVPDERYAANPAKGSGHNRGIAVDVSLIDLKTKNELAMPTAFDDFTGKAHHDYMQLDSTVIANRNLLKTVMENHGFTALQTEWWHYSLEDSTTTYEVLDLSFEELFVAFEKIK